MSVRKQHTISTFIASRNRSRAARPGIYERYTRDAEMPPANEDDRIAQAGDDPIVKNMNQEEKPKGPKELVSILPTGFVYSLETAQNGGMILVRYSSDDALDLGAPSTGNAIASVGDRAHSAIAAMNRANRQLWAKNAPAPKPTR
ncbi:hypothetical protein [Rhodopila sp.]|uniref:hypothetical protein n=1 Tax=Rhodopila sp. TaxID=2480087 RepID=UPI003D0A86ED